MPQNNPGAFPDSETGTEHAGRHNLSGDALLSSHSGAVAPTYALDGTIWLDTSGGTE